MFDYVDLLVRDSCNNSLSARPSRPGVLGSGPIRARWALFLLMGWSGAAYRAAWTVRLGGLGIVT